MVLYETGLCTFYVAFKKIFKILIVERICEVKIFEFICNFRFKHF